MSSAHHTIGATVRGPHSILPLLLLLLLLPLLPLPLRRNLATIAPHLTHVGLCRGVGEQLSLSQSKFLLCVRCP